MLEYQSRMFYFYYYFNFLHFLQLVISNFQLYKWTVHNKYQNKEF